MSISHHPVIAAEDLVVDLPDGRCLFGPLHLSCASERTGLVGDNGTGKTLLLDVLVGLRGPSRGTVVRNGTVAYVPQRSGEHSSAAGTDTVADHLGIAPWLAALHRIGSGSVDPEDYRLMARDGWDLEARARGTLARLGVREPDLERPMSSLSGGEAARVALAGALLGKPELLVLDEPTNDLDRDGRRALVDLLAGFGGGLLVVSHDRELLGRMDRILELSGGQIREYGGDFAFYRDARERERAAARAELESARGAHRKSRRKRQDVRERQEQRRAAGHRSRQGGGIPKILLNARKQTAQATSARLGRVQEGALERSGERLRRARERVEELADLRIDVQPSGVASTKEILRITELEFRHPGADESVIRNLSWTVTGPERWTVTGPNGIGKSTLLELVMGRHAPTAGTIRLGLPQNRIAYLDQEQSVLGTGRTVLGAFRAAQPEWDESEARHLLARFLFPGTAARADVDILSGGERMRAALACILGGSRSPGLLLLDEPTNHLDLRSLETLEAAAEAFDGALVAVTHDPSFLDTLRIDRTLVMAPGEVYAAHGRHESTTRTAFEPPQRPGAAIPKRSRTGTPRSKS